MLSTAPTRAEGVWRSTLYDRFRESPYPLTVFEDGVVPAASLWAGSRRWVEAFRATGLQPGDRLVLALPACSGFLQVMLAALWENLSLAFARPTESLAEVLDFLDARCGVAPYAGARLFTPDAVGGPSEMPVTLRPTRFPPTPDVRFLLQTSGTMGQARWVALSDTNLHATLRSHLPLLNLEQARVLSILPWHHAFGLLIDLFPALLSGAEIVRDPDGGRSTDGLIALLQQHQTTHLSGVPITFQRLMERETGRRLLQGLQGGVIGGAPVTGELAQFLATTRLRVGYGQTEASPGITLGEPGQWAAHCMGRPIGCQVYINAQGVLHFAGPNACYGFWEQNGLRTEAPDRWVNTGDIVREADGMLYFAGRYDDQFKLSNGRYVLAGLLETQLKEHLPEVEEALLCCVDGERLRLYISQRPNAAQPEAAQVRACLGALGSYLTQIVSLPQNAWIRTPKGVIDRQEMLRALEHTALAA